MAMLGTGRTEVSVKIQQWQTGRVYEVVVKDGISLTRTPNAPSVLRCSILRDHISVEEQDIITLTIDGGHNCFYGYVKTVEFEREWANITAYDQIFNLQKNKRRFIYEDATASDILRRIVEDNEIRCVVEEHIMDTEYRIPYRIESGSTYQDIIKKALDLTYMNNNKKFYLWDDFGNLCLHSEEWLSQQPYLQITAQFCDDYKYTVDGTERYSAVRIENMLKEETAVTAENPDDPKQKFETEKARKYTVHTARNEDSINKFGLVEYYGNLEEGENGDFKAQQLLKQHEDAERTLTLSKVQGDIQIRGGTPVLVDFFSQDRIEFIRGWFSTESVTHNFNKGRHTMDMTLKCIIMLDDWSTDTPDYTFRRPDRRDREAPVE